MKLYLMRHGPAEDNAVSGHDADRALTAEGRDRVRAAAALLLAENEAPLHIVTSPLVRALQTAELVAARCDVEARGGSVTVRRELMPGASPLDLLGTLRAEKRKRLMLVGHEPTMSSMVFELLGRSPIRGVSKAMVIGLSLSDDILASWGGKFRFALDAKLARVEREVERAMG